jgi:SAM-dependent methyltransferase
MWRRSASLCRCRRDRAGRARGPVNMNLDPIYVARFPEADREAKDAIWQVLCHHFFQRYVGRDDVVLDLGPGFGEFLNHIRCGHRIAVDIERLSGRSLPAGTQTFLTTLAEIRTVLRPGGRLMILQPNIRLVGGAYWDFVDHHLPLTDRTLEEACESLGLDVVEVIPRFLPYTTRSSIPQSPWLVRLYLAIRPAWWLLGRQTWMVARKPALDGTNAE